MASRPGWYSLESDTSKSHTYDLRKSPRIKKKPPDLNLKQPKETIEKRRHAIQNSINSSPPYSPLLPITTLEVNSTRSPVISPTPLIDISECRSPRDRGEAQSPDSAIFVSPRIYCRDSNSSPADYSPPYSPDGVITSRTLNKGGWHQQPRKRSLTPIPESKLNVPKPNRFFNSSGTDSPRLISPSDISTTIYSPDFLREISTAGFHQDDIKVIVGSNKIRIISERNTNLHRKNSIEKLAEHNLQELHKVVDIPKHIEPSTIKVKKYNGKIVIHGFNNPNKKGWSRKHNGFLTTPEDTASHAATNEIISIKVNIPPGFDSRKLRFKTITKHYLVISGSSKSDKNDEHKEETSDTINSNSPHCPISNREQYLETFELPSEPDRFHISSKLCGKNTLLVDVPLTFRPRSSSM